MGTEIKAHINEITDSTSGTQTNKSIVDDVNTAVEKTNNNANKQNNSDDSAIVGVSNDDDTANLGVSDAQNVDIEVDVHGTVVFMIFFASIMFFQSPGQ